MTVAGSVDKTGVSGGDSGVTRVLATDAGRVARDAMALVVMSSARARTMVRRMEESSTTWGTDVPVMASWCCATCAAED